MLKRYVATEAVYWKTCPKNPQQTIVMIHGFRGTHHGLLKIVEHLPEAYEIIIPDLPGFGESAPLASHNLKDFTEWLRTFIDELHLEKPPILVGHSFGSIITSAYASDYPETIEKLVLINPIAAPALEGPKAIMTKLAIFYYQIGKYLPEKVAHYWLGAKPIVRIMSVTMAKTHNKDLRRYIHDQHDRYFSLFASPESVLEAFTTSTSHNVGEVAKEIPLPTLIIAGDQDDITPIKKQYELSDTIPNSHLEIIKDVGHLTHYETPKEVADFIYAFIKSE